MKQDKKLLFQIFITFLKISPMTFGGGYAMIPLLEREIVRRRKWINSKDITDVFAVAESVPGAIAINSATFVGYRVAGVMGGILAMLGIILPTLTIVLSLSMSFLYFKDNVIVDAAFQGIRASIVALIIFAAIEIGKTCIEDKVTMSLAGLSVVLLYFANIHPVLVILSGALIGIVLVKVKEKAHKHKT